jgi:hypothetical protein
MNDDITNYTDSILNELQGSFIFFRILNSNLSLLRKTTGNERLLIVKNH